MLPNFLIIGAQKAATTWLSDNLSEHPDIFISPAKETYYFNHKYKQGIEWYQQFFANCEQQSAVGEATPGYLPHPDAPKRIKETLGDPLLIALLRQPVDRAYSAFWQHMRSGDISPNTDFVQYFESDGQVQIRTQSYYHHQLERYFEFWDRSNMLVLLYEELFEDPKNTMKTVFRFLNVDPMYESQSPQNIVNAGSKNMTAFTVSTRKFKRAITPTIDRLPSSMKEPLKKWGKVAYEKLAFDLGPRTARFEPLDPLIRLKLTERYYANEIESLERLLNFDLSGWKK